MILATAVVSAADYKLKDKVHIRNFPTILRENKAIKMK